MLVTIKFKLAFACYAINAIGLFIFGLIYTFSSEFLPFHSDAIQEKWGSLNIASQTLYLGMMRTEGAGMLASSIAIAILLFIPFRRKELWSFWAMSIIGVTEHIPSLIGAYNTTTLTPANSPWQLNLIGIFLLLLGLFGALNMSGNKGHLY